MQAAEEENRRMMNELALKIDDPHAKEVKH